ncbi:hypothetical protein AURDEDRAFT_144561 [Auricularia subglabra TFB-10046 SS5]|nr:hypothetical protein AURDEDRAFT_144561 [Auricularia subglabra TFB-10046 SS5]
MIVDGEDGVIKRQPEPASPPLPTPSESDPLLSTGVAGPSHRERPPPNYQAALASPVVHAVPPQEYEPFLWIKQRESVDRRFFRALGVALVIWVVLATAVEIIYTLATHANISVPTTPSPNDGKVLQCYGRTSPTHGHWNSSGVKLPSDHSSLPKYQSTLNLELPTDAALLYLLSAGSLAYGSVMVLPVRSEDLSKISVMVEVRYYSKDAFRHSDVCALERDGGARGIGIYTPSYAFGKFPPDQQLEYRIEFRIPVLPPGMTFVRSFETHVPHFLHLLEELGDVVEFGQVSLEGTNANVGIHSLTTQNLAVRTSNAFIAVVESIRANETVALFTSNAYVDARVDLVNSDSLRPARLAVVTNNGDVRLQANLIYAPEADVQRASFDGSFDITAYTSNARSDLAITHAPAQSKLSLSARTSNGPLTTVLYPAFEGDVLLHTTSLDGPSSQISDKLGPVDPRYHGRRYVATQEGKRREGEWRGHLAWEPSEHAESAPWWGRIDMTSSNARCRIAVPCVEANCLPVVRLGAG